MIICIISSSLLTLSLSIFIAPNPFIIGLTILLIALLVSSIYSLLITSWFAFLIYLIYVGGILIIFSYFLALTPNQPSTVSIHTTILISTLFLFIITSFTLDIFAPSILLNPQIRTLYNPANSSLLILLVLTLLITIIAVVKLCSASKGPLRAFISYV